MQQHLEPSHVADLLLPLPDDQEERASLMGTVVEALEARERSIQNWKNKGRQRHASDVELVMGPSRFLVQQCRDILDRPEPICHPGRHGWRDPERLVDAHEVVVDEVQGDRASWLASFLLEGIG